MADKISIAIYALNTNEKLCNIEAEKNWTIGELKRIIEAEIPELKRTSQSLREDSFGSDLENATPVLLLKFRNGCKLFVKNLGPQISWTTVFISEYLGPLIIYAAFALRPNFVYLENNFSLDTVPLIPWGCWIVHFGKRLMETIFVHRFSHETMPVRNLFKNCGYYWVFAAIIAYHINHPNYSEPNIMQIYAGLIIFGLCEIGNLSCHMLLRDLRPAGSNIRKLPRSNKNPFTWLFNRVSCPNYTYEFGAWVGFTLLTNCVVAALFALVGLYQMTIWAQAKHRRYKKDFHNYPQQRVAIIPYLL